MKIDKLFIYFLISGFWFVSLSNGSLYANNIQITNAQVIEKNNLEHWVNIRFDISIERGWRINTGAANWSAAWIFVKYQVDNGVWHHATLSAQKAHYFMPANVSADPTSDGKGVFIYDARENAGTYSSYAGTNLVIRWNYGLDGVADNASNINIQVLGIEMVYVPESSYYLGSGGNETNHFYTFGGNNPYEVMSENSILVGNSNGNLYYNNDNIFSGDRNGPIPNDFPKGFKAFYAMRYEITQEQYVDFLNQLTRNQQITRTRSDISGSVVTNYYVMCNSTTVQKRNGIRCDLNVHPTNPIVFYCDYNGDGIYNGPGDGQNIACGYLNWGDLLAYYDWAGLRPMSELEYEKACRGNISPIANEYAWGSTVILQSSTILTNAGQNSEITTNAGDGLCNYDHVGFPMRAGFAARATTNRIQSGACFYGFFDMSGNISEKCVTIGTASGRSFTGLHGDGELNSSGDADVLNWPGFNGSSSRGGNYSTNSSDLSVSSRTLGSDWLWFFSSDESGGRGVRTAN